MAQQHTSAIALYYSDIVQVEFFQEGWNVETTMVYTHVMKSIAPEIHSPLDEMYNSKPKKD